MKSIKELPSHIRRKDDNEIFVLSKNGLYYLQTLVEQFPKNLHFGYTYDRLIEGVENNFEVVDDKQFGPKVSTPMQPEEMEAELARLDAPTHDCCRCGAMATIFRYGAFFCNENCAESAGDFALDDGQQAVPDYLHDLNSIRSIEEEHINDSNVNEYSRQLALLMDKGRGNWKDWIWKANPYQRAEALLKTLTLWRD